MKMTFEVYPHTADVGVRGYGATLEEAFQEVAKAMFSIMVDISSVKPLVRRDVLVDADDLDLLLIKWLNSLLAISAIRFEVYSVFSVKIEGTRLEGQALGQSMEGLELKDEIKAATFADLIVKEEGGKWVAQCIVDVRLPTRRWIRNLNSFRDERMSELQCQVELVPLFLVLRGYLSAYG